MGLQKIFVTFALLGLLIFGIMNFIVTTQVNNDVDNEITEHSLINETYGDLYNELRSSETESETVMGNFTKRSPTEQFGELSVTSIFSPTTKIKSLTIGLWNILIKLPMVVLGVSPIVASVITTVLIFSLIIGIWLMWKGVSS